MIFGSQDDQQNQDTAPAGAPAGNSFVVGAQPPTDDSGLSAAPADDTATSNVPDDDAAPTVEPTTPASWPDPGLGDESTDSTTPADEAAAPAAPDYVDAISGSTPAMPVLTQDHADDLLTLKQQALNDLSPLVDHLDQSPEEKFRTTMMMIQSTDNQALLKEAYAAAQAITDDKVRAQALLDVVNEINYFTQHAPAEQ